MPGKSGKRVLAISKETQPYRTELTPVAFLRRSAYVFPDALAVVHGERRYTYRQFEERVNRLASGLRAAGLRHLDRVAFICPNTPAMLEAHFGVPAAGLVLVPINTRLNSDEIGYILKHSGAKFAFVDHELEGLVKPLDLAAVRVIRGADTGAAGATHVCLRRVESARIWDLIDKEGVTHYCGAPTVQIGIVNDPKAHPLPRPVTCAVAGAPPSPTLLARLKELGFRPVHVYGLTETYGPHTVCAWHAEWDRLPADERSEEHTSELQSRLHLVCRLLLEKKKKKNKSRHEQQPTDIT